MYITRDAAGKIYFSDSDPHNNYKVAFADQ